MSYEIDIYAVMSVSALNSITYNIICYVIDYGSVNYANWINMVVLVSI